MEDWFARIHSELVAVAASFGLLAMAQLWNSRIYGMLFRCCVDRIARISSRIWLT